MYFDVRIVSGVRSQQIVSRIVPICGSGRRGQPKTYRRLSRTSPSCYNNTRPSSLCNNNTEKIDEIQSGPVYDIRNSLSSKGGRRMGTYLGRTSMTCTQAVSSSWTSYDAAELKLLTRTTPYSKTATSFVDTLMEVLSKVPDRHMHQQVPR